MGRRSSAEGRQKCDRHAHHTGDFQMQQHVMTQICTYDCTATFITLVFDGFVLDD